MDKHYFYNGKVLLFTEIDYYYTLIDILTGKILFETLEFSDFEAYIKNNNIVPFQGLQDLIQNPNNFDLTGEEARFLLKTILNENTKIDGNLIFIVFHLVERINNINLQRP